MTPFVTLMSSVFDSHAAWSLLAEETMPRLVGMYWVMLITRVLHILGAIILVGGLFYLWAVVSPMAPTSALADQQFGGRRGAWAKWVGIATLLLLVTGFWNYIQNEKQFDLAMSYRMIALLKIMAGLVVFFVAALLAGRSATADQLRQKMPFWLRVTLTLGIVTAILGSVLRSYPHIPKSALEGPKLESPSIPPPSPN